MKARRKSLGERKRRGEQDMGKGGAEEEEDWGRLCRNPRAKIDIVICLVKIASARGVCTYYHTITTRQRNDIWYNITEQRSRKILRTPELTKINRFRTLTPRTALLIEFASYNIFKTSYVRIIYLLFTEANCPLLNVSIPHDNYF